MGFRRPEISTIMGGNMERSFCFFLSFCVLVFRCCAIGSGARIRATTHPHSHARARARTHTTVLLKYRDVLETSLHEDA